MTTPADFPQSIGVSAIVRFRRPVFTHPAGTTAMVIGQASNGRLRYSVMVPSDPMSYSVSASDLEVLQGCSFDWWLRQPLAEARA